MLRIGLDQHPLDLRFRGTPERQPSVAVVIIHVGNEGPLAANKECRRSMAWPFAGFGE